MDLLTASKSVFVGGCLKYASEIAILTSPIETKTIPQMLIDGTPTRRGDHVRPKAIERRIARGGIERVCGRAIIDEVSANQSDQLGIAPNRFVIAGASAGGHLAALIGTSNHSKPLEGGVGEHLDTSSSVQAIVSFYGAANLETILAQSTPHGLRVRVPALELLLGGQPKQQTALAKLASPVNHVGPEDPALWLIHGDADPQMPFDQSVELMKAYRVQKLPVRLEVVSGGQHGGSEFYATRRLDRLAEQLHEQLPKPLSR